MKKLYFYIIFSFTIKFSLAQELLGPHINAMGNAGVALQQLWSINSNAAGILKVGKPSLALAYENKYNIKELSSKSAAFVAPFPQFTLGSTFTVYGNGHYALSKSGLALAKKFGQKLFAAVKFNYHTIRIAGYGNESTFSVEAGFQTEVMRKFWLGAHIANPNQSKFSSRNEELTPTHIRFGAAYYISDKITISSEIEKLLNTAADFKMGLAYRLAGLLSLRTGFSANPFKQYGGIGISLHSLAFDISVSSHPVLGPSPQIAIAYGF